MVSTHRQMAFVPVAGGPAGLASRRAPAAARGMVTPARPLGRVAARRPVRRAGGRATPVASVQPGDRTKDGEEVVVAAAADGNAAEEEDTRSDKQKEIDRLKAAEKYVAAAYRRQRAAAG